MLGDEDVAATVGPGVDESSTLVELVRRPEVVRNGGVGCRVVI
jgi:hypothetical protein